MGGSDWIRAARREKKKEEIGGDRYRIYAPARTGARGTGDPVVPATLAATAEVESVAWSRATVAP